MLTRAAVAVLASLAETARAACSIDTHHPENGGYYIEGANGLDSDAPTGTNGRSADDSYWGLANEDDGTTYYEHGDLQLCTGDFCTPASRVNPEAQYRYAMTCARVRFSFTADSGTTVYQLPDQAAIDACDFSGATLLASSSDGTPHYDYLIEDDAVTDSILFFASEAQCADGVKMAVYVSGSYGSYYDMCYSMGTSSSRIQNCDCDHVLSPSTLVDPCFSGFVAGCYDGMPDDQSCCPAVDGGSDGTCESTDVDYLADMNQAALDVYTALECQSSILDQWQAGDCPSDHHGTLDRSCTMYKGVELCGLGAMQPSDCVYNRYWAFYESVDPPVTVECPEEPSSSSSSSSSGLPTEALIGIIAGVVVVGLGAVVGLKFCKGAKADKVAAAKGSAA